MNEQIPHPEDSTAPPVRVTYRRNADKAPAAVPRHIALDVPAVLAPLARDPAVARLRLVVRDEAAGWAFEHDADEDHVAARHVPLDDGRHGFAVLLVKRSALPVRGPVDADRMAGTLANGLVREVA